MRPGPSPPLEGCIQISPGHFEQLREADAEPSPLTGEGLGGGVGGL